MYPSWTLETCSTFFLVLLALLFTSGNLAIRLIRKRDRLGSHGEMDYINQFQLPSNAQANSPLFDGTIPGEIRDRIFAFTLSCFESQKAWDRDSSYVVRLHPFCPVNNIQHKSLCTLPSVADETQETGICGAPCRRHGNSTDLPARLCRELVSTVDLGNSHVLSRLGGTPA